MPTARELLEQADALMRRNRARDLAPPAPPAEPAPVVDDDVPELTEVAAEPAAEAGGAPDAVTQAVAPVPVQFEPPDAPAATAVPDEASPEGAGPPLREALARELAAPTAVYPPPSEAPRALDDIPELTEIVEEIEAPSILDAGADFEMGEPSVWMEPGHGEVSILGKWPDVPVAAAVAGDDHGKAADAPDGEAEVGVLHVAPDLLDPALAAALPADDVLVRDVLAVEAEPETATAAAPVTPIAFAAEDEAAPAEDETEVAWVDDEPAAAPVEDEAEAEAEAAPVESEARAELVDDEREAAAVEDQGAAAPVEAEAAAVPIEDDAEAAPAEDDAERWDRLAEEVRMQVLQRIDIFTDTGLQEQLARRLQPMVDRASADLVATINHHVGALMRAYVAEAIEREIEKWREGSR